MAAYVFTAAQLVDIRRFCGYPPRRSDNNAYYEGLLFNLVSELEYIMTVMTSEEAAVITGKYLPELNAAEQEIFDARANLKNSVIAGIKRDELELPKRRAEFQALRYALCDILGCNPGPRLSRGTKRWVV